MKQHLPEKTTHYATLIGEFYLRKNNGDYEAANKELDGLHISKLEVDELKCPHCKQILPGQIYQPPILSITCAYVGKLIGKWGENIEKLSEFLGVKIKILEDPNPLCFYLNVSKEIDEVPDNNWSDLNDDNHCGGF